LKYDEIIKRLRENKERTHGNLSYNETYNILSLAKTNNAEIKIFTTTDHLGKYYKVHTVLKGVVELEGIDTPDTYIRFEDIKGIYSPYISSSQIKKPK